MSASLLFSLMQNVGFRFRPTPPAVEHRVWKVLFLLLLCALAIVMCLLVPDYGSSGDELARNGYGQRVLAYFTGLGPNPTHPLPGDGYMQPYGPLFDVSAAALIHLFHPQDEYLLRHDWNALFGFAGITLGGLCAHRITGSWRTAFIAALFLLLTPRYFGDAFNNPKDVPFAAMGLFFLYALLSWLEALTQPQWGKTYLLGASLLACMSIRPGGLLFVLYAGGATVLLLLTRKDLPFRKVLLHLAVASCIGYFGSCLFWPDAMRNPFINQLLFFKSQSKLIMIGSVLFEGRLMPSPKLPWYYAFRMLFITTPFLIMAALAISYGACISLAGPVRSKLVMLHLFILFPLAGIIARGSVFYDGVRHLLFIVVMISLAAAIGAGWMVARFQRRRLVQGILVFSCAILAWGPAAFMVRNHPFEYTYYNESVGGLKGAYGRYETDYYNYSVKQAYEWLINHEAGQIAASKTQLKLASGCYNQLFYNYTVARPARLTLVDENFFTQNASDWDYGIFISRYIDGPAIQNGYFPYAAKVIHEVKADGIPICVVLKNDAYRFGYKASRAMTLGHYPEAIAYGRKAADQYPKDLEIWSNLARAYLAAGAPDSAQWASNHALELSADNNVSVYYAAEIAFRKGDAAGALRLYQRFLARYPHLAMTWLGIAQAQAELGNLNEAERCFWNGYSIDTGDQYRIYKVLEILARKKGLVRQAAFFAQRATTAWHP